MNDQLLAAIITSITTAASTAGVAITALILNNKRFDLMERRLDKIEEKLGTIESSIGDLTISVAVLKSGGH